MWRNFGFHLQAGVKAQPNQQLKDNDTAESRLNQENQNQPMTINITVNAFH